MRDTLRVGKGSVSEGGKGLEIARLQSVLCMSVIYSHRFVQGRNVQFLGVLANFIWASLHLDTSKSERRAEVTMIPSLLFIYS